MNSSFLVILIKSYHFYVLILFFRLSKEAKVKKKIYGFNKIVDMIILVYASKNKYSDNEKVILVKIKLYKL